MVAASAYGSSYETPDLDVCYNRDQENLTKLADALRSLNARPCGTPVDIPFRLDAETLRHGLNFKFETNLGALGILGEVRGIGGYRECLEGSVRVRMFEFDFNILSLHKLILAKRTAGRPKDMAVLPELEAILEFESMGKSAGETTHDHNDT